MSLLGLVVAALLLLVTALLRAAGASLVRTPRADAIHDAAEGDERAAVVAELLDDRARLQPALSMVNTLLLVTVVILATWALTDRLDEFELFIALLLVAFLVVAFGDFVPRKIGRSRPRVIAYRFAWLLRPAVAFGDAAADLIDVDEGDDEDEDDDDEEALADAEERVLISSILEFTDTIVREVMTPRTDMIILSGDDSTDAALDLVLSAGRSRIPVLGEGIDDVLGVLYARDLLKLMDADAEPRSCNKLMRAAYFVPETKRVSELLRDMQNNQVHLAIVVDEFGGTAGVVTIEDLLEEIVGEIADEYDREEPMVTPLEGGSFLVDGRMAVDELAELIGVDLPDDEWDTVGGLVLGLAGRVPREGEAFILAQHVFVADRVQGRRIARVRLEARP